MQLGAFPLSWRFIRVIEDTFAPKKRKIWWKQEKQIEIRRMYDILTPS